MSRGPGHVERAIKAAFEAEPARVFTTEYLCSRVYAGTSKIEKKHRVSLIRAAKRVLKREHGWCMARTSLPGAPFLFFNQTIYVLAEIAGPHARRPTANAVSHRPAPAHDESIKV